MRQIAVYIPYKGETIVARIPLVPEIEPNNLIELRAAIAGLSAEAMNQCLEVAGQIDQKEKGK